MTVEQAAELLTTSSSMLFQLELISTILLFMVATMAGAIVCYILYSLLKKCL